MKTIKPQRLGLLSRCFEFKRRFYLGVSVLGFIPLGREATLLPEVALWPFLAEELGKDAALDAGIPKSRAEYLVTGRAYVPGGEPQAACQVRVRLGEQEKLLYVFGDRYWNGRVFSEAAAFTEMPLDWEHAFGGEGYPSNPLGKGFQPVALEGGGELHALPNTEDPAQRITGPDQRPAPAGLGPIDLTWPQRSGKCGTHDEHWLQEHFPGFAPDIDWSFFNLAPADQQFPQAFRGDEAYLLENLHPGKPLLEGVLPGIRARCFVERRDPRGPVFEEVGTRLTTVWFFPHAEKAVLVYQGTLAIREEDAADVLHLLAASEWLQETRDAAYYRNILGQRLDKEKGYLLALRDQDLLPAGLSGESPLQEALNSPQAGEGLMQKRLRKKAEREIEKGRAVIASYGLDPDVHGPKPLPPEEPLPGVEDLPEYIEKLQAQAEAEKQAMQERNAARDKEMEALFSQLGMDYGPVLAEQTAAQQGPPAFTAAAKRQELQAVAGALRAQGLAADELEQIINDPGMQKLWADTEVKLKENYRKTAHQQDAAARLSGAQAAELQARIRDALGRGESLAEVDLTGADLHGLDLRGANLEGAFLESANLDAVNLEGANLSNAVLAHASLNNARLSAARLRGANLGGARLVGAQAVEGADFSDAILSGADLTRASLAGAVLQGADLSGAIFAHTDLSGIQSSQLLFMESDLRGARFVGAELEKCAFLKVDVTGTDFAGAVLESAVFLGVKGQGARFHIANMRNVRFVETCHFESADFTRALLDEANLRGAVLGGADFSGARMSRADFSETDLRNTHFNQAVACETQFVKADLREASLYCTNLMNANLQRSNIRGTDLRGSNLFQADLARVHADNGTLFAAALLTKMRTLPRRSG